MHSMLHKISRKTLIPGPTKTLSRSNRSLVKFYFPYSHYDPVKYSLDLGMVTFTDKGQLRAIDTVRLVLTVNTSFSAMACEAIFTNAATSYVMISILLAVLMVQHSFIGCIIHISKLFRRSDPLHSLCTDTALSNNLTLPKIWSWSWPVLRF